MKKSRLVTVVAAVLCFLLLTALSTMAQQSVEVINYQGKLTNSDGSPLEDGTYSAMFEIFDTPSPAQGQDPLWKSADDLKITVIEGVFSVELGAQNHYCPIRGLGEKPSPLGEDFSMLAVWSTTANPAIPYTISNIT